MKRNSNKIFNTVGSFAAAATLISGILLLTGCDPDDPQKEDVPELVTKVTLTFTPSSGTPVVVTATDPDGQGILPIDVDGSIDLEANKSYTLSVMLINELAASTDPAYNITAEVEEEGDEHLFFYAWTNDVFSDPAGNGNVDDRTHPVNYDDEDVNGLPIGLETTWTAAGTAKEGTFRILLKHQPGLKSATSTSSDGEDDVDLTFDVNVQ